METFHEDILETFLFCLIASFGIIQIMVGRRGWNGLSIYGGRVRENVNNAMGAGLIIFAYAYYFGDPLHRNVRNIEGFMSLFCLGAGILAGAAATLLLAWASESLRRVLLKRRISKPAGAEVLTEIIVAGERILVSPSWGERGTNLVLIAESGRGGSRIPRIMAAAMPAGRGMICLQPASASLPGPDPGDSGGEVILETLRGLDLLEEYDLEGETFMGLGWGSNLLLRMSDKVDSDFNPRRIVAVDPVVPDIDLGLVGDALASNPPQDILERVVADKPWKGSEFRDLLKLWWPLLLLCVAVGTVITFAFDVRWKLLAGPLAGTLISLWLTYFTAVWRGRGLRAESPEAEAVSVMSATMSRGTVAPSKTILTPEEYNAAAKLPDELKGLYLSRSVEFWSEALRGKFLLRKGTMTRLVNLIWEDEVGE
ncbi:MAG: hypothetical protein SWK76_06015 [Actinomycetota bacterium]|nr:hypothetical protein [Actinomycetota bacterium]